MVARQLKASHQSCVVVDTDADLIELAREQGYLMFLGGNVLDRWQAVI
ncbi:MAG: hypothetical protein F6K00_17935 [Leptolyngbya sp. SIOISBB]|nr:hypothetical protein [Leptolyngbya sp. SIOISBB]